METFERELKALIIDKLMLPDLTPAEMDSEEPLIESYGLDSIDVLELAMAIDRKYGVEFEEGDEKNAEYFHSVESLAAHISEHRTDEDGDGGGDDNPYDGRKAEIYDEIVSGLIELFDFSRAELTPQSHLIEDLGLDSLDALDLVVQLQDRFGARVPEDRLTELETIDDVVEMTMELSEDA